MTQEEISELIQYKNKMRQDGLEFLDKKFKHKNQEQKDILLYGLFLNASVSQETVLKNLYGIDVDDEYSEEL